MFAPTHIRGFLKIIGSCHSEERSDEESLFVCARCREAAEERFLAPLGMTRTDALFNNLLEGAQGRVQGRRRAR